MGSTAFLFSYFKAALSNLEIMMRINVSVFKFSFSVIIRRQFIHHALHGDINQSKINLKNKNIYCTDTKNTIAKKHTHKNIDII